jgi:hypothetical protein
MELVEAFDTVINAQWSGKFMKNRVITVSLVIVLLFSAFAITVAFADVCPRCNGTGKITGSQPCPTCQGSSSSPAITKIGTQAGAYSKMPPATSVTGTFHNEGTVEVEATVTAQVKKSQTETFTNTVTATFPPGQDTTVTVKVDGVEFQPYCVCTINVEDSSVVNCPTCSGTGSVSAVVACPDCGGTGVVSGFAGGLSNLEGAGGAIIGVIVVGAVVVAGFFVVKKRRVTEQSLRRLSSFEFQDWVIKKLSANPSSQKDSYLGIDAYTMEGYPVQIRQDDDVGKRVIDSFAAAMARNKARTGTLVALSFGKDALEGVMKARLNYRLEIKTVTVKELLTSQSRAF